VRSGRPPDTTMKAILLTLPVATIAAVVCLLTFRVLGQGSRPEAPDDVLFRNIGYIGTTLGVIALAAGVGYGSFKKTALNEAVSLAQTRKELILILESDKAKLELRNKELERENERLEKKNLRLQDENKE
jgi:hypothetical protein